MKTIVGLETEYGALLSGASHGMRELFRQEEMFQKVRDHVFYSQRLGIIDQHQRAYDEPPGNGGFLLNGGRLYIDMGHVEYATPECHTLLDLVRADRGGDFLLQDAVNEMGLSDEISFIKNNIDHQTLATFGSHENYLVSRDFPFTERGMDPLVAFLVTRQIITGSGRVGAANVNDSLISLTSDRSPITFQISQRADYIVNKFYQWVQMNRSIVNTRDEPLSDPVQYRRMHLLLGDSNMSEFATALKFGITKIAMDLVEEGKAPKVGILDPVRACRSISHDMSMGWKVQDLEGDVLSAVNVQELFHEKALREYAGRDEDTDWVIREWGTLLNDLARKDPALVSDRLDWAAKYEMIKQFRESEKVEWTDPWLESLDLEYHNIDPSKGLFRILEEEGRHRRLLPPSLLPTGKSCPPSFTRAEGRSIAVSRILENEDLSYIIQWFGIQVNQGEVLYMLEPLKSYRDEVSDYFQNMSIPPRGGTR
ncbi:MAG: proteasome accessory factor PafA2 family protein [Leptospirales bacterium]